jgi:hypothetical protein
MKKSFFSMNAIIAVIILFSLSACEKENTNSASAIGKATITGSIKVRNNLVSTGPDSVASVSSITPQVSVKIYAKYNSKDLVTSPITGVTYGNIIKELTVSGDTYSFSNENAIDANLKNVTVTLYSDDFKATLTDNVTNPTKIFTLAPVEVTVTKDVIRIQDLVFRAK